HEANQNIGKGNGNGSHDYGSGDGRTPHTARVCTYKYFLNCQPLNFKGTEGAVGLAYWFEKMEYVFYISNCTVECQVKYATCTLLGGATLMKMMTENYCPMSEIKKLETEMVPEESDIMEKYTGGLPDSIQGRKLKTKGDLLTTQGTTTLNSHLTRGRMWPGLIRLGQRAPGIVQKMVMCFECGSQGHFKRDCPKLKNQNHGNAAGNDEARGRDYALGGGPLPSPTQELISHLKEYPKDLKEDLEEDPEEDLEQEPSEEEKELSTPADSPPAGLYIDLPFKVEEDKTCRFGRGLDLLLHLRGSRLERVQQSLLLDIPSLLWPEDAQDDKAVLRARVSTLERERRYHRTMAIVVEGEMMVTGQPGTYSVTEPGRMLESLRGRMD
nr:hypothetical protein [Tanacetum cinerariifolium]